MASYGQPLDYGYKPYRDSVYRLFVQYFNNPVLYKIKEAGTYSVYMAKIHALLGIEKRYLIVFASKTIDQTGQKRYLTELQWDCLQTRSLPDEHDIPEYHSYTPTRLKDLDRKITLENSDVKQYNYRVEELPIRITLLAKTSSGLDYNRSGTVVPALETYQTIVNFVD